MNVTRMSLYPHELQVLGDLTFRLAGSSDHDAAIVGPQIFKELVAILYGSGTPPTMINCEFSEVE